MPYTEFEIEKVQDRPSTASKADRRHRPDDHRGSIAGTEPPSVLPLLEPPAKHSLSSGRVCHTCAAVLVLGGTLARESGQVTRRISGAQLPCQPHSRLPPTTCKPHPTELVMTKGAPTAPSAVANRVELDSMI
jgi:hypothetical protein